MDTYGHAEQGRVIPFNGIGMQSGLRGFGIKEERLPFTVRIARTETDLEKAVGIRASAYARHVPAFAETLRRPETYDREQGSIVLLAESKFDGSSLGTMRIQTNLGQPLGIEESLSLPDWLQGRRLAEATRLGVAEAGAGRVVKTVLFKAYWLCCLAAEIDWMVITARKPLDRQYQALQFIDVVPGGDLVPMHHVGNIPHRVMAFEVGTAEERWTKTAHPLLGFMCGIYHPDLDLSGIEALVGHRAAPAEKPFFGHTMAA